MNCSSLLCWLVIFITLIVPTCIGFRFSIVSRYLGNRSTQSSDSINPDISFETCTYSNSKSRVPANMVCLTFNQARKPRMTRHDVPWWGSAKINPSRVGMGKRVLSSTKLFNKPWSGRKLLCVSKIRLCQCQDLDFEAFVYVLSEFHAKTIDIKKINLNYCLSLNYFIL